MSVLLPDGSTISDSELVEVVARATRATLLPMPALLLIEHLVRIGVIEHPKPTDMMVDILLDAIPAAQRWLDANAPHEARWRDAAVVRCPACGHARHVDQKDAADPRAGGYYCEGTTEHHRPEMMLPSEDPDA